MKLFKRRKFTKEEKKERRHMLIPGLISGIFLGVSFPPFPYPFRYLIFFALVPYLFVIQKKEKLADLNRFTYFTFFFFNLIALYWVGSWTKEADPFLMLSGVALVFFNPLLFLIPSTLFHFARKTSDLKTAYLLFPFFWVFYEFLYTLTDLRFPWLTLANGATGFNLFIQPAEIIGAYGISLLVLFANIAFFFAIKEIFITKKYFNKKFITALLIVLVPIFYGLVRTVYYIKSNHTIKVGLVQPNLNPWAKWHDNNLNDQINQYLELSDKAVKQGAGLIIWPESALPVYLLAGHHPFEEMRIHGFVDSRKINLLTGMPDALFYPDKSKAPQDVKRVLKSNTLYATYNSILLFKPNSREIQRYGKMKLVPFGERVPFLDVLPFLGDWIKWNVGISSWNVGTAKTVFTLSDSTKIGGVICIESIYPDFVSEFVKNGAQMITVVTNDSWYGYSSGPFQHKEISVLRAVENRRTVLRAANGGISCIIDPLGRTVKETELFTKDFVVGEAQINDKLTFYTSYPFIIPFIVCIVSCGIILAFFTNKLLNKWKKQETL
jgi:apolipoprotein N-acyltransferase